MGNVVLRFCKGTANISVILADGKMEEYVRPVKVETVLQRHPQHTVVKLDSQGKRSQLRRKVTFMRPEQRLKCNQEYFVLPKQSDVHGGKFVDCWTLASKALESNTRRAKLKCFKGRKRTAMLSSVSSAYNFSHQEIYMTSVLSSQYHNQAQYNSTGSTQGAVLNISKPRSRKEYEWRPSLDSIPESIWSPLITLYDS